MASPVTVDKSAALGAELVKALEHFRNGLAVLRKLEGRRATSIAVSAANFGSDFGVTDETEAAALSDRFAQFLEAYDADTPDTTATKLHELLDATFAV